MVRIHSLPNLNCATHISRSNDKSFLKENGLNSAEWESTVLIFKYNSQLYSKRVGRYTSLTLLGSHKNWKCLLKAMKYGKKYVSVRWIQKHFYFPPENESHVAAWLISYYWENIWVREARNTKKITANSSSLVATFRSPRKC